MRTSRIVEGGAAYYHIMSRVVDRRRIFDDGEKELFRKTIRAVEGFSVYEAVHLPDVCLSEFGKTLKQRVSFSYNGIPTTEIRGYFSPTVGLKCRVSQEIWGERHPTGTSAR